jgi:transcriptional regulator with XRE-family HTH domain
LGIDPVKGFVYSYCSVKKTLADRLAFLISELGIMQKDFAHRVRYTQAYVSMVLSGAKPSPGRRFIEAICREFSVNEEWIANGKGEVFSVSDLPLSSGKAEILAKFRLLPADKQKVVEDIIDGFLQKSLADDGGDVKKKKKSK